MTVISPVKISAPTYDPAFAGALEKIQDANLKKVLTGQLAAENYLNGLESLKALEISVQELKQEDAQEYFFFRETETKKLIGLNEQIRKYLNTEEEILENSADKFNSRELEIISSRIILLKDIQWILEKDILTNFGKIIDLSGAKIAADIRPAAFKKYRKINLLLNAMDRLEVRGRDSAGLQISFALASEDMTKTVLSDLKEKGLYEDYSKRLQAGDTLNGSIGISSGVLVDGKKRTNISFVFAIHCL